MPRSVARDETLAEPTYDATFGPDGKQHIICALASQGVSLRGSWLTPYRAVSRTRASLAAVSSPGG